MSKTIKLQSDFTHIVGPHGRNKTVLFQSRVKIKHIKKVCAYTGTKIDFLTPTQKVPFNTALSNVIP